MMRQPMENGKIVVSRNKRTCTYPADFMLVAAMNPCPCGYYPNRKKCSCTDNKIRKYTEKISGPLLDRIDMLVQVCPVPIKAIRSAMGGRSKEIRNNQQYLPKDVQKEESSAVIRRRVEEARKIQRERYQEEVYSVNAHLSEKGIEKYCRLSPRLEEWLMDIVESNDISYRGYVRILKLARTIADMEGSPNIEERHLTEAVMFRMGWNDGK